MHAFVSILSNRASTVFQKRSRVAFILQKMCTISVTNTWFRRTWCLWRAPHTYILELGDHAHLTDVAVTIIPTINREEHQRFDIIPWQEFFFSSEHYGNRIWNMEYGMMGWKKYLHITEKIKKRVCNTTRFVLPQIPRDFDEIFIPWFSFTPATRGVGTVVESLIRFFGIGTKSPD